MIPCFLLLSIDCLETPNMLVPISEVESRILAKVIEFCKFHHLQRTSPQAAEDKKHWNKEFTNVDKNTLFNLIIVSCGLTYFHIMCRS